MEDLRCKKILNSVESAVRENLFGIVAQNPDLRIARDYDFVFRHNVMELKTSGKVLLLSGGGSGHEPLFAGYVGKGMLTAAIAGPIFTSPPSATILAAIRLLGKNNKNGVLMLVNNYTGDRLNFGLALERARREGIIVDMVLVSEDCALQSKDKSAGRRGLAGCILAIKIAGAMAEAGKSLEEICKTTREAIGQMGTIGIGLSPCVVPGSGPSFSLASDEMELGLGIHGESGVKRLKLCTATLLVKKLFDHMLDPDSNTRLVLHPGAEICLLVNNLGGISQLEMNVVVYEARKYAVDSGFKVERLYSGTLLTSLEMAGVSLTVFCLGKNPTILNYLDADTCAPAWPRVERSVPDINLQPVWMECVDNSENRGYMVPLAEDQIERLRICMTTVFNDLMEARDMLNALDREGGDGDCGTTIYRGAKAMQHCLYEVYWDDLQNPVRFFAELSNQAELSMGGTSGALYSLLLDGISRGLGKNYSWIDALEEGLKAIIKFGGAEPGDRTMVDPLDAFVKAMKQEDSLKNAVLAAESAAQNTANMKARAGRASYGQEGWTGPRSVDPGAHAVALWIRAAFKML